MMHDTASTTKLIVGLGNPGSEYETTRHNLGWMVLDALANDLGVTFKAPVRARAVVATAGRPDGQTLLVKPTTYMNRSGEAVQSLVAAESVTLDNILVVCDDFSLPLGQLRLRRRGSDGGHNGIASVIASLGSAEFARLRLGIGPAPAGRDPADFVLEPFAVSECRELEAFITESVQCIKVWLDGDIEQTMTQFNKRK